MKDFDVDIESFGFNFSNLINGNDQVTELINKSFNENAKVFLASVRPYISKAVETLVTTVLNRTFKRYTVDELYPPQ